MTKFKLFSLTLLLISNLTHAHGGHDHDAPAKAAAPKGGTIKELENTYVEVLSKKNNLKIYLYDKNLKPKKTEGFQIELKAQLPRTKNTEQISFVTSDTFFEGVYDAKNLHRYTLLIQITDPSTGHKDIMKFTIEPKR